MDVLFTTPSMDDLILAFDDDGDDDDDKDGNVQLHVDVDRHSQFLDENIPSEGDPLTVEVAMNKFISNHLVIIMPLHNNANWVDKFFVTTWWLHSSNVCGSSMHYSWLNLWIPFIQHLYLRRLMMAYLTLKKAWRIGMKNAPPKNIKT